ncbi:hypothetical protein AB0P21_39035 [Kribbella sp. NPDC056861]|uniref:hypothetical protein n=1 Tax=Kribbella sp. NPDC056861 TaxID=3154857 RepID=UPI0034258EC8
MLLLGITAVVLVWTGHEVTWALPARSGALWLLDTIGIAIAAATTKATLTRPGRHWPAVAIAVVLVMVFATS